MKFSSGIRRAAWRCLLAAACAWIAPWQARAAGAPATADAAPAAAGSRSLVECARMAPEVWPTSSIVRRAHIIRMELARPQCIDHAGFLAVLGALLLDDGDAAQALIWLERSLLLDPGDLGTQADHALALAQLGEPTALAELSRAWKGRSDLPPALREKLFPSDTRISMALPPAKLGGTVAPIWSLYREVSVMGGYEDNLDHSPRLIELTLTTTEGPFQLPVISQPRSGPAVQTSGALQIAWTPDATTAVRSGLSLNARSAPADSPTDWHHVQWAASASKSWAWWRLQAEVAATWIGGRLTEPYRLVRLGLAAEARVWTCRSRLSVDVEQRTQDTTRSLDGRANGITLSQQCPLTPLPGWTWMLALRGGVDQPDSVERPGGRQDSWSAGLRLSGPLGPDTRLDLSLRKSGAGDAEGYSPLLQNNAVRTQQQLQWALELSRKLDVDALNGAELVVQYSQVRQSSNLELFQYNARSLYGGLRWAW